MYSCMYVRTPNATTKITNNDELPSYRTFHEAPKVGSQGVGDCVMGNAMEGMAFLVGRQRILLFLTSSSNGIYFTFYAVLALPFLRIP